MARVCSHAVSMRKTSGASPLVDDYLAAQPPSARATLRRVRAIVRKALPGAVEGISYQMPVYKLDGRMVLYFAGFRAHYSIYPATARLLDVLKPALAGRLHSKATIRFSYDEPVPAALITRIAKVRAAEAASRARTRATRKPAGRGAKKR